MNHNATEVIPKSQVLSKAQASRIEQKTLTISLIGVILIGVGSLAYGLYIQSDVVILNGIFSLCSLIGSGLNLTAAKFVARPADKRFQYGYWHVEPLVHCINGLTIFLICLYAIVNGIEALREGGHVVDANRVIGFSIVTGVVCAAMWLYEVVVSKRIKSELVKNDSREWLMDFGFSFVTLIGFAGLFFLEDPWYSLWARYADPALVIIMSLVLIPYPISVINRNIREVLQITDIEEVLVGRVDEVMKKIQAEHAVISYTNHILKVGRTYFVEVNILVGPAFRLQTIAEQDQLRERICQACDKPLDELWLSVCITANARWS